jgi:nucleoside-diphosphate-sugar epimerase
MATKTSVLITGATGFVGAQVARQCLRDGMQVTVLSRPASSRTALADVEKQITWQAYDGDYASMKQALAESRPDIVMHLASCFLAAHKPGDLDRLVDSNVRMGLHLAEAMTENGCRMLINTGTAWQHFHDEPYCPVNLYAATKQAFDALLKFYEEAHDLRTVTLKLFDTYGPGDSRAKLLPLLKRVATTNESLDLSPGEQLLDFVHVDDVAHAFCRAGERLLAGDEKKNGTTYAISSGAPLSLRDLVTMIESVTGRRLPVHLGARPYRPREVMRPWSTGPILPGWKPQIGLREGLAEYFGVFPKKYT